MDRDRFNLLLSEAERLKAEEGYEEALAALEEAHIIAQANGWSHLIVHCEMFKLALEYRMLDELIGQIPRILLALPGSLLGIFPTGNIGSTKMGIFEKKKE